MIHLSQQLVDLLQNHGAYFALAQVIIIDLVMAGDNAVVIGMAAARLPPDMRHKVIFWGLAAAVIMRVAMATVTVGSRSRLFRCASWAVFCFYGWRGACSATYGA